MYLPVAVRKERWGQPVPHRHIRGRTGQSGWWEDSGSRVPDPAWDKAEELCPGNAAGGSQVMHRSRAVPGACSAAGEPGSFIMSAHSP